MIEMTRSTEPLITPAKIPTRLLFDELLSDGGAERGSAKGEGEADAESFRLAEAESFRSAEAGVSTGGGVAGAGEGAEGDGAGLSGKAAARLKGLPPSRGNCSSLLEPFLFLPMCLHKKNDRIRL